MFVDVAEVAAIQSNGFEHGAATALTVAEHFSLAHVG